MPEIVADLTRIESIIEKKILDLFSTEEICAFFLSKKIHCIHQFDDHFIGKWYKKHVSEESIDVSQQRSQLVLYFTSRLIGEKDYDNHLKYWIRKSDFDLVEEMKIYFRK